MCHAMKLSSLHIAPALLIALFKIADEQRSKHG
jgi:hypothetical protein